MPLVTIIAINCPTEIFGEQKPTSTVMISDTVASRSASPFYVRAMATSRSDKISATAPDRSASNIASL